MLSKDNNLKTFMYMLLYYLTDTEMNAYLQTFYNQVINSEEKDIYSSDIFKRYKIIKTVLETDFDKSVIEKTRDEKRKKSFQKSLRYTLNLLNITKSLKN